MKRKLILSLSILIFILSMFTTAFAADLVITTEADLKAFATEVNDGNLYEGLTVELGADIILTGAFTPIGNASGYAFSGTFDGQGYTISGLNINVTTNYNGLFGNTASTAIIKNVIVSGNVTGGKYSGGIVGYNAGTIENCISNCTISAYNKNTHTGGITGYNKGTIKNCVNNGDIIGYDYIGGITGENSSTITQSYNSGSITGVSEYTGVYGYIGGIAGISTMSITEVYNEGNVTATSSSYRYVGGITGYVNASYADVSNVYNTGIITGSSSSYTPGGIIGWLNEGNVSNAYNRGTIINNADSSKIASICGYINVTTVSNTYWLDTSATKATGNIKTVDITSKTDADFKSKQMVELLNASQSPKVWIMIAGVNDSYPILQFQVKNVIPIEVIAIEEANKKIKVTATVNSTEYNISKYEFYNNGNLIEVVETSDTSATIITSDTTFYSNEFTVKVTSVEDEIGMTEESSVVYSYDIKTVDELNLLSSLVNDGTEFAGITVNLVNDIDLNGSESNKFTSIGNEAFMFSGTFDGNSHTITGLYINDTTPYVYSGFGLFGKTTSTTVIKNLNIAGQVTGGLYTGGLVGYNVGAIENCEVNCIIFSSSTYIGGITGYNEGTIKNCINKNKVSIEGSLYYVGGIAGYSIGPIENSINEGLVTQEVEDDLDTSYVAFVGGIVGYLENEVVGCYNKGEVKGQIYTGGIAGQMKNASIKNCINEGKISHFISTDYNLGGIVGYVDVYTSGYSGVISDCCNKGEIYGQSDVGGIAGFAGPAPIIRCYNEGYVEGRVNGIGGIAGHTNSTIELSYNTGDVVTTGPSARVGGIVGSLGGVYTVINNVYNTGHIIGGIYNEYTNGAGGIIGTAWSGSVETRVGTIKNAYNRGLIESYNVNDGKPSGIIGKETEATIQNTYYLNTSAPIGIPISNGEEIISKTAAEMTTDAMVALLNADQDPAPWGRVATINEGYPILIEFLTVDESAPTDPIITAKLDNYDGEEYNSGTYVNRNVVIEVESSDANGIAAYEWSTNADSDFTSDKMTIIDGKARMSFVAEMNQTIYFRAKDNNDNYSSVSSIIIRIDKTAPKGSVEARAIFEKDGVKYTNSNTVIMDVTVTDNISTKEKIKVATVNEDEFIESNLNGNIDWLDFEEVKSWNTSEGDGLKKAYIIFKDEAGNQTMYAAN